MSQPRHLTPIGAAAVFVVVVVVWRVLAPGSFLASAQNLTRREYAGRSAGAREVVREFPRAREVVRRARSRAEAEAKGYLNSLVFETGNFRRRYLFYPEHINYVDQQTGEIVEADPAFAFQSDGSFAMQRASYAAVAPAFADGALSFTVDGETVTFTALGMGTSTLALVGHVAGVPEGNRITYADAFAPGADLVIQAEPDALQKLVVFRTPLQLDADLRVEFATSISASAVIRGRSTNLGIAHVRQPGVWDAAGARVPITVELSNGKLTKILPREFFNPPLGAPPLQYPVTTDVTTSYYAGAGDGYVYYSASSASWATAHDYTETANTTADYTSTTGKVGSESQIGGNKMYRAFFPVDTSGIADNDEITAARLNVYVTAKTNGDNDGDDWLNVVQTTQAATTSLVADDYDQCGSISNPTEGATRIDLGSISTSAYNTFTLNSTGEGWISKTGTTKLGLREGHDALNSAIASSSTNDATFSTSENTGTSQDPYLDVDTTAAAITKVVRTNDDGKEIFATSTEGLLVTTTFVGETNGNTTIEYVVFMDLDADNTPDTNETYVTNSCAGSGLWSANNYTKQTSAFTIADGASPKTDSWECATTNFPEENGVYKIYTKWYDANGTIVATGTPSFQFCDQPTGSNSWWDTSMANRVLIQMRAATFTEALVDFPILVKATTTNQILDDIDSSGDDVRFLDEDTGTMLNFEKEFVDATTTREAYWWVQVPKVATSTDCDYIMMYYDNTATSSVATTTGVWRQDYYEAVWHFGETSTGTTYTFQDGVSPDASYAGTEDLNLESGNATTNQNADTSTMVDVLSCAQGGAICRALMQWDVSTIPATCSVASASLTLSVTNGTADSYGVYAVRRNWGETTATYNTYDGSNSWTTAGVGDTTNDRYGTDLMNGNSDGGFGRNTTGSLTFDFDSDGVAAIEDWIDGTITNNGLVFMDHDSSDDDGFAWDYRGNATASKHPLLTVVCGPIETYLDSTLNNHDETNSTVASRKEKAQSKFGYSPKLAGSAGTGIGIPDSTGFDLTSYTITGWFRRDGTGDPATFSASQTLEPFIAKGYAEADTEAADIQFSVGYNRSGQATLGANWEDELRYTFQEGVSPDASYTGGEGVVISSGSASTNLLNYTSFQVDVTGGTAGSCASGDCHVLMQWDISTVSTACTVASASVTINVTNATADRYGVYALRRNWTETGATWNTYDGSNNWTTAGGLDTTNDRYGTDLMNGNSDGGWGSASTGSVTHDFDSDGLSAIQDWIDGTVTNNGIIIMDHDSTDDDGYAWATTTDATTTKRPKLTIGCENDHSYLGGTTVANSAWRHFGARLKDKAMVNLYLDGYANNTTTYPVNRSASTGGTHKLGIGTAYNTSGTADGGWLGYLDEMRIYKVAIATTTASNESNWLRAEWYTADNGMVEWGTEATTSSELTVTASSTVLAFTGVNYSFSAQTSTAANVGGTKVVGSGSWTLNLNCNVSPSNCAWRGATQKDRYRVNGGGVAPVAVPSTTGVMCVDAGLTCTSTSGDTCSTVTLSGAGCFGTGTTVTLSTGSSADGTFWFAEQDWAQGIPAITSSGVYTTTISFDLQ